MKISKVDKSLLALSRISSDISEKSMKVVAISAAISLTITLFLDIKNKIKQN